MFEAQLHLTSLTPGQQSERYPYRLHKMHKYLSLLTHFRQLLLMTLVIRLQEVWWSDAATALWTDRRECLDSYINVATQK